MNEQPIGQRLTGDGNVVRFLRPLTVDHAWTQRDGWQRYKIDPPVLCEANTSYIVRFDHDTKTATIEKAP